MRKNNWKQNDAIAIALQLLLLQRIGLRRREKGDWLKGGGELCDY